MANETEKVTSGLAIQALKKLGSQRKNPLNLTSHSNQGSQFTSVSCVLFCR